MGLNMPQAGVEVHIGLLSSMYRQFKGLWSGAVDNYEVVEFVTIMGGTFNIRLPAPRWSTCAAEGNLQRAKVGLAWTWEPSSVVSAGGLAPSSAVVAP